MQYSILFLFLCRILRYISLFVMFQTVQSQISVGILFLLQRSSKYMYTDTWVINTVLCFWCRNLRSRTTSGRSRGSRGFRRTRGECLPRTTVASVTERSLSVTLYVTSLLNIIVTCNLIG